jgi:hypothetical protein
MRQEDILTTQHRNGNPAWLQFEQLVNTQGRNAKALNQRVQLIAQHMAQQWQSHTRAVEKTNVLFEQLLNDLEPLCEAFKQHFTQLGLPTSRTYVEIDPDRSVGILSIQWHTISFTVRGNSKPFALSRSDSTPLFSGRIIALVGDFQELAIEMQTTDYPDLLQFELASLYVPDEDTAPAVMRARHLGDEESFFHPGEAARMFLLKTVEMTCGGGFFHETEY